MNATYTRNLRFFPGGATTSLVNGEPCITEKRQAVALVAVERWTLGAVTFAPSKPVTADRLEF